MNRLVVSAAIGALLFTTGCGSAASLSGGTSSSPVAAGEPGVNTYLCSGSTDDMLLQWRDASGDLSGTYEDAQLSGQAPSQQVSADNGELSGTLDGTAITLSVGFSQPLYGTLSGSQLTLNVPESNGTIQASTCNQSSLSEWNKAVAALNGQVGSDNQAANQAAASQASASASAQQESSAQGDASTLQQDTGGLSGDLNAVAGDVKSTDGDLASERSDAANGNGDNCTNASSTVYNDAASTVYNDVLSTAYNDGGHLAEDITTVRKDITTVQGDQSALSNAGLPRTQGSGSAISAAQSAISSAISTVNRYIDHLNGDLDAAYQIADSVGTGACAGDGPGQPPQGLDHLN
jgi:hypothetical protein